MPSLKDHKDNSRQQQIVGWFPLVYVAVSFVFLMFMILIQIASYHNHKHAVTLFPHGELQVLTGATALQFIAFLFFLYKSR